MKTTSYFRLAILGLAISTFGCKKDDKDPDTFTADQEVAVDGNRVETETEDVSEIEDDIMAKESVNFGRVNTGDTVTYPYGCGTFTVVRKGNNSTGKVTVNFGTGCVGDDGKTRKGIIEWTFTDRIRKPNAVIVTSFINYGVKKPGGEDFVMIDNASKKTTTNNSQTESANTLIIKRDLDMKLNFSDGASFTQQGTKNIKLELNVPGNRWDNVHTVLTGSSLTGIDRRGRNYTWTATSDIVRKSACALQGIYKPVSGVLTIANDSKTKVIDFGNGNCDNEVTVTINGKIRKIRWQ
jgi:hypothetical protein